ncbi:antibiotic biosynthesis monooxygenase [Insolitispirillum peregrinum]|uniref:ABM domain-containing protein n=1 Tax=Insolitispirillum peregrinum TaxID=80876 RepID=A0A1N7LN32_9PROT|nr:antibiotic biosynthesis monooxygenase [Insolitispirillum peregrinum]SIS75248.1 hypothetical protein SAMN05421779_103438 [Insolitispirillum peregrinum]
MSEVSRIVHRHAKPGCAATYETLVRGMLEASSHFPGYLSAAIIPPHSEDQPFQIIQRFATQADLDRWRSSPESADWHQRLAPVVASEADYRTLSGLEVWFPAKITSTGPARWRLAVVTWMGIFPTVAFCLWYIAPLLAALPFLLKVAILTILVVLAMTYGIMPRLSRWMGWWLKPVRRKV